MKAVNLPAMVARLRAQSNQRGIEMKTSRRSSGRARAPQSNQRGIEMQILRAIQAAISAPQSNQRGIEMEQQKKKGSWHFTPQSNQRGIEISISKTSSKRRCSGLNRTSVGLKSYCVTRLTFCTTWASIEPAWD